MVQTSTHMVVLLQHHQEFDEEFMEHTVFLCSNHFKIQLLPDVKYIVLMALSTENLCMNSYCQQQTGQDMFICIDASHHYMFEGYRLLVVKPVNYGHSRHMIGYRLVSHEDEDAPVLMLECLKDEVEHIMNAKSFEGVKDTG